MANLNNFLKAFTSNNEGVTAMEYALIGSLIAIVIIGSITDVGLNVQALFMNVADKVAAAIADAL